MAMGIRWMLSPILLALAVPALGEAPSSPVGDAFLELRGLTGHELRAACERVAEPSSLPSESIRRVGGDVILHGLFLRASSRDRFTLARLMARLSDPFSGRDPFLVRCGDGLSEAPWFRMRTTLAKALKLNPEFVPRLLRDADPVVAEAAVGEAGKEQRETVRRALLIWSGSANPRFRVLAAYYVNTLPVDEREIVVDRMLDDPDPLLRREAVRFVDGDTARAVFPRVRYGFRNGSPSRKVGILHLGFLAADISVSKEISLAGVDADPDVREAARELAKAMEGYRGSAEAGDRRR